MKIKRGDYTNDGTFQDKSDKRIGFNFRNKFTGFVYSECYDCYVIGLVILNKGVFVVKDFA